MTTRNKRTQTKSKPPAKKLPVGWIAAGVLAFALAVAMGLSLGDTSDSGPEFGSPAVTGEPLEVLVEAMADPAIGRAIPAVSGADFDGARVSISPDDGPQAIVFLAHWCPHCQAEVPEVQQWVDQGGLPHGVSLMSVATAIDDNRPNYPSSAWLDREGWTAPVLVDDEAGSVWQAFGGSAFPYWVFVNADGTVAARTSGNLSVETLAGAMESLANS